jgi:hypothetical protein
MLLSREDEQKDTVEGTLEACGRSTANPVDGWYGFMKGMGGLFGMYVPPVLEMLELVGVEYSSQEQPDQSEIQSLTVTLHGNSP